LRTWETLSAQGRTIYETQKYNLDELRTELSSLRSGYDGLTHLYALLSQSNEDLNQYNAQIGERMQERDQDLAAAYDEIDKQGRTIPRLIIAIIVLCIPYMVKLGVWVAKKVIANNFSLSGRPGGFDLLSSRVCLYLITILGNPSTASRFILSVARA
jgi:hypothetical protein